jgi:pyridoxal phosphate enzyme (YggS family)
MSDPDSKAECLANYRKICTEIAMAEKRAGRPAGAVTLVIAAKTQPAEKLLPLLEAGHRVFGENRVQEAAQKWPALKQRYPDIELHLIGPLQSNKLREALALFDVIETLDREKLAQLLHKESAARPLPRLFIQVNSGEEEQKAGIFPKEASAFISLCRDALTLPVQGLMCIPPHEEEPSLHFALLEKLAGENKLDCLSMGMSGDFTTAIMFGATHVRIGSALFGLRATEK